MLTGKWGYPKAFPFYPVESLYKILALFLSGFLLALVFYVTHCRVVMSLLQTGLMFYSTTTGQKTLCCNLACTPRLIFKPTFSA